MRRLRAEFTPDRLRALALALGIGTIGGAVFAWFKMPLAWMIGAMCLTTASALAGAKVSVPTQLRTVMIAVLGVMLGSFFRPELFERAGEWTVSLSMVTVYVAAVATFLTFYFRRVARYDHATAFFSAIPGGLVEMTTIGTMMGGDERSIALTHASRILLVILVIPFGFRWWEGYQPSAGGILSAAAPAASVFDLVLMASCGIVGVVVGKKLRIPGAPLIGPLALSGAAHLAGLTDARLPGEAIIAAQVVLGSGIGCRFAGVRLIHALRAILIAVGSTFLMLGTGVAVATALNAATGLPVEALVLAFSPGGLAEMCLTALALGIDPAFVSTHHFGRILIVVMVAPAAFRLLQHVRERRERTSDLKGD
jgi:membrane AbrB-like protein